MAGSLLAHRLLPTLPFHAAPRLRLPRLPPASSPRAALPSNADPPLPKPRRLPRLPRICARPQEAGGGGYAHEDLSHSSRSWSFAEFPKPVFGFVVTNFLPIALVTGLTLALIDPTLGCLAHRYGLSKFSTFGIFLISGLMLRDGEVSAAKEAWPVGIYGLVSILILSPFLSKIVLQLHFKPQEFVTGLAIFCCVPTTLSSGVALTTLVKGNTALALAMTVISNLLGILIVPFTLAKFVAGGVGVSLPTRQLFKSLTATLLVPLVLGKVFRNSHHSVAEFVDQNRQVFSMTSAILLSLVPWIQVSKSRHLLLMVRPVVFMMTIVLGILLHVVLLVLNSVAVDRLAAFSGHTDSSFSKKENARAVILVASQKTLPVMAAVVGQLGGALGESGLLVLPGVAAHINQIIFDSFVVNSWLHKDQSSDKNKKL